MGDKGPKEKKSGHKNVRSKDSPYWIVAQTKVNSERVVQRELENEGFVSYMPLYQDTIVLKGSGRVRRRVRALFPGYIFIQVERVWRPILWLKGIRRIVAFNNDEPVIVRQRIIDEIRCRELNGLVELPKAPERVRRQFEKGELVKVGSGPFKGHAGIYEGMSSKGRERVLLSLFGRPTETLFYSHQLEEVNDDD